MALARELGGAGAFALGRPALVADWPAAERIPALAWLPAAGLIVGGIAALVGRAAGSLGPVPAALTSALVLAIAHGRPGRWDLRLVAATVSAAALAGMAPPACTLALVVAPMLARWAAVVQCYGGLPRPDGTGMALLAGRVRFREFGIASVTALGITLILLDAVGLAIAVGCMLATLAIRVLAYRRAAGLGDGALETTIVVVETLAIFLLSSIGSVLGPR
jgi:cobalamin synthase